MDRTQEALKATFAQNLISEEYLETQRWLHAQPRGYGGGGHKWAKVVAAIVASMGHSRILDYGCGQGTLRGELLLLCNECSIKNYDPAVDAWSVLPGSADLVVCTDVLEHIEPELLDNVLEHILGLADREAFFVISTKPANKTLPDGRNAHLIVESADWWRERLNKYFDITDDWQEGVLGVSADELVVCAVKKVVKP